MFFVRSDSETLALGLKAAQWTSLALVVIAGVAAWVTAKPPIAAQGSASRPRAP
jgi:hypothetical protein